MDDTIAPAVYRTGRGDRAIPLTIAAAAASAGLASALFSGPAFWPWGLGGLAAGVLCAAGALARWSVGRRSARWHEAEGQLELRGGGPPRFFRADELVSVRIRPAAGFTELRTAAASGRLPHRLVRVDRLLDRLRERRPDLFPTPADRLVLPVSAADLAVLAGSVAATAGAGWLLYPWKPWVGVLFVLGAGGGALRLLFGVPRSYVVTEGVLTVNRVIGRRRWRGSPTAIREDAYAAGGAVFFRMRLSWGRRTVVLDEGHLAGPLRPHAGWIVHRLAGGPRSALY